MQGIAARAQTSIGFMRELRLIRVVNGTSDLLEASVFIIIVVFPIDPG